MAIETTLRKWGNSFGVVIPVNIIEENGLQEGEKVIIEIEKNKSIKELFGSLKGWKINTQKMKDGLRKEWSKW